MSVLLFFVLLSKLKFDAEKMEILKQEDASRVTHLVGDVHLYDEKLDIRGAEAWFAPAEQSLVVSDSLRIRAQDVDITADSLWFDTAERVSHLYRRVVVTRDDTEIRAPQLVINHRTREAHIPYGARIRDLKEGILITGDEVDYSLSDDAGTINRNPLLREDADSTSFTLTSRRMYLSQRSRTASAAQQVRIVTEDATVLCDTLTLYYHDERGHASGSVNIESPEGRIQADSADFRLAGRRLEEIFLYPQVTARYRTEGTDSVVVNSPCLTIDLKERNRETLIFSGGTHGTYFWHSEENKEEER